ncbi:MAG: hypothetical protein ABDH49_08070, partial [Candidatus Hydrothermales bacterium]
MKARNELTKVVKERYLRCYISPPSGRPKKKRRKRRKIYDEEVKGALIFICKILNTISSHRLKSFIKEIVPILEEK